MQWIPLTRGLYTLVDDEDYKELSKYKWSADDRGYAHRRARSGESNAGKDIRMHQQIMEPGPGMHVDHINGVRIDNRRSNLRVCTRAQNLHNAQKRRVLRSSSKYKGVSHHDCGRYRVRIRVDGANVLLGWFSNEEDAARAYNAAAVKYRGEFAWLNRVPDA